MKHLLMAELLLVGLAQSAQVEKTMEQLPQEMSNPLIAVWVHTYNMSGDVAGDSKFKETQKVPIIQIYNTLQLMAEYQQDVMIPEYIESEKTIMVQANFIIKNPFGEL